MVNEELCRLGDEYWDYTMEINPTHAMMLGDHRFDEKVEEASREAEDSQISRLRGFAGRAEAIDPACLDKDERITRDVLIFEASTGADALETRAAEFAVNHAMGLQAMIPVLIPQLPIEEPEHAEALIEKYRGFARVFDEMAERLREGLVNGRTPPALTSEKTIEQLDGMLALPIEEDPFLNVRVPASFDDAATEAWKAHLAAVVRDTIRPSLQRYRDTIADEVLPFARPQERSGVSWVSGGDELYEKAVHQHTTLRLEADEIHQIGLDQVERLAGEYRRLGVEALGTEDLTEIFTRLREDPDLHFVAGPEVVAASERALARAKSAMADWFGRLPKADCIVAETPSGPTAFYFPPATDGSRPGMFFVNTSDPTQWGRYEMEAMAYHEGIPGHHLQLAIAQELEGIPEFRKHAEVTAYAEGWGLYTERLADEMGLYSGPLERIGMLSADSLRAGRLVVDTGLHAKGWSRQQAIDFFAENSPMSIGTIENEVDRYIGLPGQALAYMIGRLEIQRMRHEAEEDLGERFDIKGFHDTVLDSGMMPLETLDRLVKDWTTSVLVTPRGN
ncbi:MAG: DUF885 family protein [Gammaproteobacteria bacterium]|nr:DUF885 family protein [Gammaproteobacteria bacterium]